MFLNVIIPSYRSKETIEPTIASILYFGKSKVEHDITVVDSSDDGTGDFVASEYPEVKVIKLSSRAFPGAARNRGVEATKGDVICFIDSDARADVNWLDAIHEYLTNNPDVAAVGGPVLNANPNDGWSRLAHWCEFSGYGAHAPEGRRRVVPTVNVAIRRDAFEKYGPFLEEQFGNEDVLLFYRMKQAGEQLRFSRTVRVCHKNKSTIEAINRHQETLGECTGRARMTYDLPGSFMTRPGLSLLIPYIKTGFIGWRILTQEPGELLKFALSIDRVFTAMKHFQAGFQRGVEEAKRARS